MALSDTVLRADWIWQALRVSMEEQRARQEDEAKKTNPAATAESGAPPAEAGGKNLCYWLNIV